MSFESGRTSSESAELRRAAAEVFFLLKAKAVYYSALQTLPNFNGLADDLKDQLLARFADSFPSDLFKRNFEAIAASMKKRNPPPSPADKSFARYLEILDYIIEYFDLLWEETAVRPITCAVVASFAK